MILIDKATGSNELEEPLRKMGVPVEATHLKFGDIAFMGRGEKGVGLFIGIEMKKIGELVTSMCVTKRFQGHQLLGITKDFDRRYLLIEGDYHHDNTGRAIVFRGPGRPVPLAGAPSAMALEQEILNMQTRGGCWVRHTTTRRDTLRFIVAAYRYWTDKDLDQHKSHMAMYAPDLDKGLLTPPTDFRKALAVLLPNVSFSVSKAIEEACGGEDAGVRAKLTRVLSWGEREWAALTTVSDGGYRRLGEARARKVLEALK